MSSAAQAPCNGQVAAAVPAHPTASAGARPDAMLAASILGSALAFIDGSVVNVALPALDRGLGAGPAGLAWIVSAYLLTLSSLILLGGALGDHHGRRRAFLFGIALFLLASLACGAAPSLPVMLAGRAAQGVGAALLMPNSLALLGANFHGEEKGRAVGTWAGVGALAAAAGPVLGGWLVEQVGWRSIFLLNLPVGLGAMALAWRYVPESRDRRPGARLDLAGGLLVTLALGLATWALTEAARAGGGRAVWAAALAAAALFAGFGVLQARRGENALMPLFLIRARGFAGVTLLTFFLYGALGGLLVLLPFVLIRVGGYSPVQAGAALLPVPVLIGLGSRAMGRVAARVGARWLLGGGALAVAAGLALYARLKGGDYAAEVLPATALVAVGMAVCAAPLTTAVIGSVDDDHVGAASGFNSAVARMGGLVATALLGFVFAAGTAADLLARAHAAALAGAGAAVLAGACALVLVRPTVRDTVTAGRQSDGHERRAR